jgi:hypothetical protein
MQNLSARWDAASEEAPTTTWRDTRWRKILQEFSDWLNKKYGTFLRASLVEGSAPDVHYVRLWPRGQRNSAFTILTTHSTDKLVRVLGKDSPEFTDEDAFGDYLSQFVKHPNFRNSLEELKEVANQPADGVLRVGASWRVAVLADIKVEVRADQMLILSDASEATPPRRIGRLYVNPAQPTAFERGTYPSKQNPPHWFVAGGYVLSIEDHGSDPDGPAIWLAGNPIPLTEIDRHR